MLAGNQSKTLPLVWDLCPGLLSGVVKSKRGATADFNCFGRGRFSMRRKDRERMPAGSQGVAVQMELDQRRDREIQHRL